jgi:hypothetical protein
VELRAVLHLEALHRHVVAREEPQHLGNVVSKASISSK